MKTGENIRCGKCKFAIKVTDSTLQCFRFPPNAIVILRPLYAFDIQVRHPDVDEDDFCGEFKEANHDS